jgi:D-lactate dehydrogenase
MQVAFFSTKPYDRLFFNAANQAQSPLQDFVYFEPRLTAQTATLAQGFPAVCAFVNDELNHATLQLLAKGGTKLIALRSAGFNHVDLATARDLGLPVVRVPAYSPYSVAEHAVGLILMLNRKLYRAYNRVRDDNFTLDGLLGFDLNGSTVGVIGTGKIGLIFARIMAGFGCRLLGYDAYPGKGFESLGDARYVSLPELYAQADIISLHCPLTPETHYLINAQAIAQMKAGVMLINTSRGHLIDTEAAIAGIKSGQIGYLGLDVYEQEDEIFFEDWSQEIILDDTFQLLQSFPNVVITAHQAFFTRNALTSIAEVTLANLREFEQNLPLKNQVQLPE